MYMRSSRPLRTFSAGVDCALRTICAHATFTGFGSVASPAVYTTSISLNANPSALTGKLNSPVSTETSRSGTLRSFHKPGSPNAHAIEALISS